MKMLLRLLSTIRDSSGQGVCGGALVTRNRVLTAAHCWFDGRTQAIRFTVVLGSLTLFSGGTRIVTDSVVMHNNWQPTRVRNDIAVIRLPSSVQLSSTYNYVPFDLSPVLMSFNSVLLFNTFYFIRQDQRRTLRYWK